MQSLRKILTIGGIFFLVAFLVILFNQLMQLYMYASSWNAVFGKVVLISLSVVFLVLFMVPVVLLWRLPRPLAPPADASEIDVYIQKLGKRLAQNKRLSGHTFDWTQSADIEKALQVLDVQANEVIQQTARNVFLATAISQNGKLDALMVLVTHTRMIWNIAHIYYQRPAPRDLLVLYTQVGTTTLLASQLEDLDVSEQIEPVLGTILQGSALQSVPFLGSVSSLILDSLLEGSINAFLTLRVGIIAKRYCGTLTPFNPTAVRKAAFAEASGMLRSIVLQTSGQVVTAIMRTVRKAGVNTWHSGLTLASKATQNVKKGFFGWFRRDKPDTVVPK